MVTAGIYLIARCMPLFTPEALQVVAIIGGFTAFMAASIALCTYDLKPRLGVFDALAAWLHVSGAGRSGDDLCRVPCFYPRLVQSPSVPLGRQRHARHGRRTRSPQDVGVSQSDAENQHHDAGRLFEALAGFPFLSGFFSKDMIIHHAFMTHESYGPILGVLALIVALMTAYYTFRLYFRVFCGPQVLPATAGHHEASPFDLADHGHGKEAAHGGHGHDAHGHDAHDDHASHGPNDGSPVMWVPLMILSVGAIFAGYIGFPQVSNWFHDFLKPAVQFHDHQEINRIRPKCPSWSSRAASPSSASPLRGTSTSRTATPPTSSPSEFKGLVKFLENKWYIDNIYWTIITMGSWIIANILAFIDTWFVDLLVNVVGTIPAVVGHLAQAATTRIAATLCSQHDCRRHWRSLSWFFICFTADFLPAVNWKLVTGNSNVCPAPLDDHYPRHRARRRVARDAQEQSEASRASLHFIASLVPAATVLALFLNFDFANSSTWQHDLNIGAWIDDIGVQFAIGMDAISLWLIVLTAVLTPIAILASFNYIKERQPEFYAWMLVLHAAMLGVFAARDILVFYFFFEFTLIPMFFIIGIWGGDQRRKAAGKFFLFTFAGSVLTLASLLYLAYLGRILTWVHQDCRLEGCMSFDIHDL